FRAIDWWVEHNNLYIKRIYGGKFSNHTKKWILKESALIGVYKNARINLKKMFTLDHCTFKHSPLKLLQTFKKLATYMQKKNTHVFVAGRKSRHTITDALEAGMYKLVTTDTEGLEKDELEVELE
ncbi:hypothetical protein BKA93DRAFT_712230, partial [Sparassis latifolia]